MNFKSSLRRSERPRGRTRLLLLMATTRQICWRHRGTKIDGERAIRKRRDIDSHREELHSRNFVAHLVLCALKAISRQEEDASNLPQVFIIPRPLECESQENTDAHEKPFQATNAIKTARALDTRGEQSVPPLYLFRALHTGAQKRFRSRARSLSCLRHYGRCLLLPDPSAIRRKLRKQKRGRDHAGRESDAHLRSGQATRTQHVRVQVFTSSSAESEERTLITRGARNQRSNENKRITTRETDEGRRFTRWALRSFPLGAFEKAGKHTLRLMKGRYPSGRRVFRIRKNNGRDDEMMNTTTPRKTTTTTEQRGGK